MNVRCRIFMCFGQTLQVSTCPSTGGTCDKGTIWSLLVDFNQFVMARRPAPRPRPAYLTLRSPRLP